MGSLFAIQSMQPSASGPRHLSPALWHRGADCFGGQLPGSSRDPGQAATATDFFLSSLGPCLRLRCLLCASMQVHPPLMAHFIVTARTLTGSPRSIYFMMIGTLFTDLTQMIRIAPGRAGHGAQGSSSAISTPKCQPGLIADLMQTLPMLCFFCNFCTADRFALRLWSTLLDWEAWLHLIPGTSVVDGKWILSVQDCTPSSVYQLLRRLRQENCLNREAEVAVSQERATALQSGLQNETPSQKTKQNKTNEQKKHPPKICLVQASAAPLCSAWPGPHRHLGTHPQLENKCALR
ncbi:hypothetical protein AAY473_026136 [Plecturocebus cupreus]